MVSDSRSPQPFQEKPQPNQLDQGLCAVWPGVMYSSLCVGHLSGQSECWVSSRFAVKLRKVPNQSTTGAGQPRQPNTKIISL